MSEVEVYRQAADLLHGLRVSCMEGSEYYPAQESISNVEGLSQVLLSICSLSNDNMEVAALSFKMGVYLGLQYKGLDKLDLLWK